MKVDIFDKDGKLIYTCPFGMYGGINYTMPKTEVFDEAFKMAIEDEAVNEQDRSTVIFKVRPNG